MKKLLMLFLASSVWVNKMDNFKLLDLDIVEDKKIINTWQEYENFDSIYQFILENGLMIDLDEIIEVNYERIPIGNDEIKKAMVAKNKKNEIIAFILFQVFDMTTKEPEMFLQYLVVNPKFQHMGYGSEILKELLLNSRKYFNCTPQEIFCYVDKNNFASLNLFKKLGFTNNETNTKFNRLHTTLKTFTKTIQQKSFE